MRGPGGSSSAVSPWVGGQRPSGFDDDELIEPGSRSPGRLYRVFLLYHQLRLLYRLDDPTLAPAHLTAWLAWASDPGSSRSSGSPAPVPCQGFETGRAADGVWQLSRGQAGAWV